MIDEETHRKLLEMKLHGMASAFQDVLRDAPSNELSFAEKLAMIVEREWIDRDNRRLSRLLRAAKLNADASLEDVWADPARGIEKPKVRELATCKWIEHKHNVIVIGKTGCGKSFLGAALAQAACRRGCRALYARVPRLVNELAIARADGTYNKVLARFAKLQVLVLDDFLVTPLKDSERRDLLEVLEDRYDHSSTVITSQLPTSKWHETLVDPTIADAICDRVIHNAHVINLKGPSGRKRKGLKS
jgi:DNA replication protein DnaC